MYGAGVPGRGNSICKDPVKGEILAGARGGKKASGTKSWVRSELIL